MPRARNPVPSYRLHRASGQAVVTIYDASGKRHDRLLGRYLSAASREAYGRIVAELNADPSASTTILKRTNGPAAITIAEMVANYWQYARAYYRRPDGTLTGEIERVSRCLAPVRKLYDSTPAADFGPLALRAVRQVMIDAGLCRRMVNQRICIVRRVFRWAVAQELIPPATYQSLQAVESLRRGKSSAIDHPPVKPIGDTIVDKTLPYCPPAVAAILRIMRLTGARPGEIVQLRHCDIDTTEAIWRFSPVRHKTANRGRNRVVYIGPKAQAVIAPYLAEAGLEDPVFSPIRERAKRFATLRAARRSPVQPSQRDRSKRKPKLQPAAAYSTLTIGRAVSKACDKAGVPRWSIYRLRHSHASEVRKVFGLEAVQVTLGHASAETSQIYAQANFEKAAAVAAEIG